MVKFPEKYAEGVRYFRNVVMEKRTGWGAQYAPEKRNREWEYQASNADTSVRARRRATSR